MVLGIYQKTYIEANAPKEVGSNVCSVGNTSILVGGLYGTKVSFSRIWKFITKETIPSKEIRGIHISNNDLSVMAPYYILKMNQCGLKHENQHHTLTSRE